MTTDQMRDLYYFLLDHTQFVIFSFDTERARDGAEETLSCVV